MKLLYRAKVYVITNTVLNWSHCLHSRLDLNIFSRIFESYACNCQSAHNMQARCMSIWTQICMAHAKPVQSDAVLWVLNVPHGCCIKFRVVWKTFMRLYAELWLWNCCSGYNHTATLIKRRVHSVCNWPLWHKHICIQSATGHYGINIYAFSLQLAIMG